MQQAEAIVAAQILTADYSRTDRDGPMVATARVVKCLRGELSPGDTFEFAETGWWSPTYNVGETRILFLRRQAERPGPEAYVPWHTVYAEPRDFFIDPDSLPALSADRLSGFLDLTRALRKSAVVISAAVGKRTEDGFIVLAELSTTEEEPVWVYRKSLGVSFGGMRAGRGCTYFLDLPPPDGGAEGRLIEITPRRPITLRFEIKAGQVEGMATVQLLFASKAALFPKRCWTGYRTVEVQLADK